MSCVRQLLRTCAVSLLVLTQLVMAQNRNLETSSAMNIPKPPATRQQPVTDDYFGQRVVDPYRWLENGNSPETQQWVREQLIYTRSVLDKLPGREKLQERLQQLLEIGTLGETQVGGEYYFHVRRDGKQNQPMLYVRKGVDGKDEVLIDVNLLSADGTVALDWWYPSHDGKCVAYGTSESGSEMSTLHVIETATRELLPDTIARTRAASIAWKPDDSGFYYTRYPKKGEVAEGQEMYNRHVFYHPLGADPAKDPLIFGKDLNPEFWPNVNLSEDGRWLLISIEEGWTKSELYLADTQAGTAPVRITDGKEFLYSGDFLKGKIYITTNDDAPRYRVFVAETASPARANWKELIPESDAVLEGAAVFGGQLYAQYQKNAASQVKVFDLNGKKTEDLALPAIGTVFGSGGKWDRKEFFIGFQSFTFPPSIYRYDLTSHKMTQWAKVDAPSIDPSNFEVKQEWYQSKDGTRVPMFIVHKKGLARDGHNPTLLTGYGGFNVSLTPVFARSVYVWLEHGGVYAVANLRGGAEFGEDWHRAGMLDKKQNVFDDFIAAGE